MELNQIQQAFAKRLRQAMEAQGYTQTGLSKAAKITNSHLKQILDGEVNITLDLIRRLALACQVEPKFFFDWP